MKNLKIAFLFFVVYSLLLLASCTSKEELESSKTSELDSIGLFMKDMKKNDLDFKTRLKQANKAFQKLINKKPDSRIDEIRTYKIYFFGYLKQYDSAVYISKELLQKSKIDKDSVSIARSYSRIAYYYNRNQQKDSAYFYYNKLKKDYLKYNDSTQNGNNLLEMAIIERTF